jgi:hypothetical protein
MSSFEIGQSSRKALPYNKRGQLGKIITNFPVILVVFLIMALFVVLAVFMASGRDAAVPGAFVYSLDEHLLLQKIMVNGEQVKVFDAFVSYKLGKLEKNALRDELISLAKSKIERYSLVDDKNLCYVLVGSETKNPAIRKGRQDDFMIKVVEGIDETSTNPGYVANVVNQYNSKGLLQQIVLERGLGDRPLYIEYYQGRCLHE